MWDIEANPDEPGPLQAFAERLVVRGQPHRAQSYLKRALLLAEKDLSPGHTSMSQSMSQSVTQSMSQSMTYAADRSIVEEAEEGPFNALHALRLELMQRLGTSTRVVGVDWGGVGWVVG